MNGWPAPPATDETATGTSGLRRLLARATEGPWEQVWGAVAVVYTVPDPNDLSGMTPMQEPVKVADAAEPDRDLIVALRNEAQALLDRSDALDHLLAALRKDPDLRGEQILSMLRGDYPNLPSLDSAYTPHIG